MSHSETMIPFLRQFIDSQELSVTELQMSAMARYDDYLYEYNQIINLTRITNPLEVSVKHFGDSLMLLKHAHFFPGCSVADVGAGAGFPGIPLAIVRPDVRINLIDSLRKRTVFLTEVIQILKLDNVKIAWGRVEDLAHNKDFREKFDIVVARAVAPLNILAELCLPLVKKNGVFLAMKGPRGEKELLDSTRAIKLMGGEVASVISSFLPLVDEERTLICVEKSRLTPLIYPRKPGIPAKQPL